MILLLTISGILTGAIVGFATGLMFNVRKTTPKNKNEDSLHELNPSKAKLLVAHERLSDLEKDLITLVSADSSIISIDQAQKFSQWKRDSQRKLLEIIQEKESQANNDDSRLDTRARIELRLIAEEQEHYECLLKEVQDALYERKELEDESTLVGTVIAQQKGKLTLTETPPERSYARSLPLSVTKQAQKSFYAPLTSGSRRTDTLRK